MSDSGIGESRHLDLLQKFIHITEKRESCGDDEEDSVELSLGLSLNGKFGVDRKEILRCSSIPKLMMSSEDEGGVLSRTFSLPSEIEDDWRKRKELQSKRRMEAKRKRFEKSSKSCSRIVKSKIDEENGALGEDSKIASQGSGGSGSSGVSDPEILPTQFSGRLPPKAEKRPDPTRIAKKGEAEKERGNEESVRGMMVNMPCVTTRGRGPNGKKIEGFLYRYTKGEDVKIVCVCHGSFLSPAEFVKHAGGGDDVTHPLKQIVVSASNSSFL
jgi:hypothetical protein